MKTDLYGFVHKAQRLRLFRLAAEIGRADFGDRAELEAVDALLRRVIENLREHAAIEEEHIHPLYRGLADSFVDFDAEHAAFEHELDALEAIGIEGQWGRLHGTYNAFLGRYLLHLAAEERAQEEILRPRFEERELAEASGRIQASLGPERLSRDLEEFFPALNAEEIAGLCLSLKRHAPDFVFAEAMQIGARMVEPNRWEKVQAMLR